jgi:hypothetical protein
VGLVPVHEPDHQAQVVVPRLLLDADHTHLLQVHDGKEVAFRVVPSQFIKSRRRNSLC